MKTGRLIIAITGASGAIYAVRFLKRAARIWDHLYIALSEQAAQVAATELGIQVDRTAPTSLAFLGEEHENITFLDRKDFFSPPASGSFRHDGMVIIPCSMGTLGRIANGISDDLVTRAADVCLKERRPLILVPRETPLNLVHLRNMTALTEAGAVILPACPGFYFNPKSIEELTDTVISRVFQQLGVELEDMPQWQYTEEN